MFRKLIFNFGRLLLDNYGSGIFNIGRFIVGLENWPSFVPLKTANHRPKFISIVTEARPRTQTSLIELFSGEVVQVIFMVGSRAVFIKVHLLSFPIIFHFINNLNQ